MDFETAVSLALNPDLRGILFLQTPGQAVIDSPSLEDYWTDDDELEVIDLSQFNERTPDLENAIRLYAKLAESHDKTILMYGDWKGMGRITQNLIAAAVDPYGPRVLTLVVGREINRQFLFTGRILLTAPDAKRIRQSVIDRVLVVDLRRK